VLYAGYPGMEAGHGITDIIFGRVSPSARFPVTVYDSRYLSLVGPVSDFSMTSNGVGRTYRYLDERKSKPLYKFGFGLSYSTFTYSELHVDTYDKPNVVVSCSVTNTGDSNAHEVAQLYLSVPGAGARAPLPIPYRSLQGFQRVYLKTGESLPVRFILNPNQISTTMANGTMVVTRGNYTVAISGHQPDDEAGIAASNVVLGSFVV
jgi:beta-glucosidase